MIGGHLNSSPSSSSGPNTWATLQQTPSNSSQPRSTLLDDDFLQDESKTIYSYFSTWSTNYHHIEPPGPGRVVGSLLSTAGSSLERGLGKLVYRAGLGTFLKAETDLSDDSLLIRGRMGQEMNEKSCDILLSYARYRPSVPPVVTSLINYVSKRSNNLTIQVMAFNFIIYNAVRFSSLRFTVEKFCQKRNEPVDVVAFLWKRPGMDYSAGWLYFYHMASRCLSTHSSPVLDILADLRDNRDAKFRDLDFSYFEEVFSSCRWFPKLFSLRFFLLF